MFLFARSDGGKAGGQPLGLFTSLPILWQEAGNVSDLIRKDAPPHWALAALRKRGSIRPLDTLAPMPGGFSLLVMAQPRPLSPEENVALDGWVRAGGKVLLFADPMLTSASAFALGDRRRPEGTVLLSPILARWGLELQFDEGLPPGERLVTLLDGELPLNLPGRFALGADSHGCALLAGGVAARCRVGRGQLFAIADATLLEASGGGDAARRRDMLNRLIAALERPE